MNLNWSKLSFGPLTRDDIAYYVQDVEWQKLRGSLIGKTLQEKYNALDEWLREHEYKRSVQVQVTNYISALRRGGLIK